MKSLIVLQYEWSSVRKFNPWLGFGLGLGLRGNVIRGHCPRTKWSYPLESFFFFSAFPVCFFTRLDVLDSATPFWDKVETFLNKVILRNQVILFLYLLLPYVIYDYLCQLSLSILPNLFLRDCLYDSRHGRINKIRLQSFLFEFIVPFVWSRGVFHPVPTKQDSYIGGTIIFI